MFSFVCKRTEIPDPGMKTYEVNDRFVVVCHVQGRFYCIDDTCTHDGGPLGDGKLEGMAIVCPRHGAKFDIQSGRVLCMPAVSDTTAHEVQIVGDDVRVQLRE